MSPSRRHLLDVDELSGTDIGRLLAQAAAFRDDPGRAPDTGMRGSDVALLFAEPSTRTRLSFELAARNLGAETFVLEPLSSSMVKGETLVDTVRNLDALGFSVLVVRHHRSGAAAVAARYFYGSVVNAGDGWHAHPTQALLDLFTLVREFGETGDGRTVEGVLAGRKIAIVGDILHSRVARSNIWSLTLAGADVWLCGPPPWLNGFDSLARKLEGGRRLTVTDDLDTALRDADAVMGLRVQKERMAPGFSLGEYVDRYQISEPRLASTAPNARYLHPGPINEGVEVTRAVARGHRSLVLEQARNGVPVRMAVLLGLEQKSDAEYLPDPVYVGTRG